MRSARMLSLVALVALMSLLLVDLPAVGATEEDAVPASVRFSTEIEVKPDDSAEGLWFCRFLLRDLATEEVLLVPSVVFPEGETAQVDSRLADGTEFKLEVRVEEGGETASWKSEVRFEERLLSVQKGTVRLAAR